MLLWDMNNSGGGGEVDATMGHEQQLGWGALLWDMNNIGGGGGTLQ